MPVADVLIVGGGLTGCATALHLAEAGAAVTLIEAGELNGGASGQNAGSLHFQIERRFLENGEGMAAQAARVLTLNRLAIDEWRALDRRFGPTLEILMGGGLMVAETDAELALLERKAAREADLGIATELIDGQALRRLAPYLAPSVRAASWLASEGHADPRTIARTLATAAAAGGADIRTRTRLAFVHRQHGGFDIEVDSNEGRGRIAARQVLLATGAATMAAGALFNLHLPVFPAGLTMNATGRVAPMLPHLIQHVGRRLSMKQTHSGNVLIGGGWSSTLARNEHGFDLTRPPTLDPAAVRANLRVAAEVVPAVANLDVIRSWTGIVALTADQLPIVGEIGRVPGLFVAAGGSGFTLGPVFARLLAMQMGGAAAAPELDIFGPGRFDHLNAFMG